VGYTRKAPAPDCLASSKKTTFYRSVTGSLDGYPALAGGAPPRRPPRGRGRFRQPIIVGASRRQIRETGRGAARLRGADGVASAASRLRAPPTWRRSWWLRPGGLLPRPRRGRAAPGSPPNNRASPSRARPVAGAARPAKMRR
nr:hypothetical protein [Tanacetum cinerariifolium]